MQATRVDGGMQMLHDGFVDRGLAGVAGGVVEGAKARVPYLRASHVDIDDVQAGSTLGLLMLTCARLIARSASSKCVAS